MSVNRFLPHLYVLPEDDADRQLAVGFALEHGVDTRRIQVLPEVGGWLAVVEEFKRNHVASMRRFPETRVVLLLDFDGHNDRRAAVESEIPQDIRERVFLLGVSQEPEDLEAALNLHLEQIGYQLAQECRDGTSVLWDHELLAHNREELERLRVSVREHLFP